MNPDLAIILLALTFAAELFLRLRSWWKPNAGSVFV